VRRALRETNDRGAALRPVLDALSRIEGRLEAGPAGFRPAAGDLPLAPDAQAQAAADATGRLLAAWAMPEQNRVPEGGG
jgi:hypothetical protein